MNAVTKTPIAEQTLKYFPEITRLEQREGPSSFEIPQKDDIEIVCTIEDEFLFGFFSLTGKF